MDRNLPSVWFFAKLAAQAQPAIAHDTLPDRTADEFVD
jgi:hypothetical protein